MKNSWTNSCKTCDFEFYLGIDHKCRRFPPIVNIVDGNPISSFPVVSEDDWCGEWSKKRKEF